MLETLQREIENCEKCEIRKSCRKPVPGDLLENTDVLFVGEAPGEEEDIQQRPFVGRSGQLLRFLLGYISSYRVSITNAVKCRPPENRLPIRSEIENCHIWTEKIIEVCKPKVIVCTGRIALSVFSSKKMTQLTMSKVVGTNFFLEKYNATIYTIYHPAFILRNRSKQSELEAQIKYLAKALPGWLERRPLEKTE